MFHFTKFILVLILTILFVQLAEAADRLVVTDDTGATDVFVVTSTGSIQVPGFKYDPVNKRLGVGTTTPQATLHLVETSSSSTRGIISSQNSDDIYAGILTFKKNRGANEDSLVKVKTGDFIGAIHASAYSGTAWKTGGTINFMVDGEPNTSGGVPTAILFWTGFDDLVQPKAARMKIGTDGKISIGNGSSGAVVSGNGLLDINTDTIRIRMPRTPESATSGCNQGELSWDSSYFYICVQDNVWKRAALSSWQ